MHLRLREIFQTFDSIRTCVEKVAVAGDLKTCVLSELGPLAEKRGGLRGVAREQFLDRQFFK